MTMRSLRLPAGGESRRRNSCIPSRGPGIQKCSSRGSSFDTFIWSMWFPISGRRWAAISFGQRMRYAKCPSRCFAQNRSVPAQESPPMTSRHRGADALVRALTAAGVRRVFTLSGNHIMSVFDAALEAGIALVHTRHEAAAVFMADAWGRLTGEPGIALVTGGPGHANAVGALYTAAMAESPVVLLSGHAPNGQLGTGAFQEMRQADIAAPLSKLAFTSASADEIAGDLGRAIRTARTGRSGPVHLSLPTDCLDGETDGDSLPGADAFRPDPLPFDGDTADA